MESGAQTFSFLDQVAVLFALRAAAASHCAVLCCPFLVSAAISIYGGRARRAGPIPVSLPFPCSHPSPLYNSANLDPAELSGAPDANTRVGHSLALLPSNVFPANFTETPALPSTTPASASRTAGMGVAASHVGRASKPSPVSASHCTPNFGSSSRIASSTSSSSDVIRKCTAPFRRFRACAASSMPGPCLFHSCNTQVVPRRFHAISTPVPRHFHASSTLFL